MLVLFVEFLLFLVDFGELKVLVINDFLALIEELLQVGVIVFIFLFFETVIKFG